MRTIVICLIVVSSVSFYSCDKPLSPMEATDREAIFNVVIHDNNRIAELEIIPSEIPDTAGFINDPDTLCPLAWHEVDEAVEDFGVNILPEPVQTDVGSFYQANVTYTVTRAGIFRIIKYNNDADSLERFSKEFTLVSEREAVCQKRGLTSQRRGWVLISIGDAEFHSAGEEYNFLDYLYYYSTANPDSLFIFDTWDINDLISFTPGENVRVRFDYDITANQFLMYIPHDTYLYQLASPQLFPAGGYEVVFSMPQVNRLFGQLRFLLVNVADSSSDYRAKGFSFNYRIN